MLRFISLPYASQRISPTKIIKAYEEFYPPISRRIALAGLALAAVSVLPSLAQNARLPYLDETWIVPYITGGTEPVLSYRTQHFYNSQNQLVRDAKYGIDNDKSIFLVEYNCYDYDEHGRLAVTYTRKASLDALTNKVIMNAPVDSVVNQYNDQGQLVKKTEKYTYTTSSYDADGNLSTEKIFVTATGLCQQVLTYSDYIAPGCPSLVVSSSESMDYYNYKEVYTYNSFNLPVTYEKWTEKTSSDGLTDIVKSVTEKYNWVYDDSGALLGRSHYAALTAGAAATASDSLGYTFVDGNKDYVQRKSYSFDKEQGVWFENVSAQVNYTYYSQYNGNLAVTANVNPIEGTVNDYAISFKLPSFALIGNYAFNIYRDGQLLKEARMSDEGAVDPYTMTYTYVDKQVTSGLHDYYVQTAQLSELLEQEPKNVSNVVMVSKYIDLPVVQNFRLVNWARDREKGYVVKVAWDAPENASDFDLQRYNFYENAYLKIPSNKDTDGQEKEWDVTMPTNTSRKTVRVECVYPYGSAALKLDLAMKEIIAGVSQVVASGVEVTYAAHVLHLSSPSNVKVYNVAGQLVKTENGVDAISFEHESTGSYVVLVEKDGQISVLNIQR